ncbi:SEC-C metal-binding domain-containing protein [Candidatus Magnetaquicoccus inordinatus]|uniref:SEC-C metal-binding domain-containing protein n=1 Tax=Candidatus Magnetaquicoccus inordinatus TaxID=2496818 RepID=UPI00102CA907|nr:SEC-C metal-binding domain-containing protein [Candidatus Magnetaquicoccus inordinatus]
MGEAKDLNNPNVYAEALVRAVLNPQREMLASWLAGVEETAFGLRQLPFQDWYLYFADRLLDMMPQPELGFQSRPRRSVAAPKIGRNDPCPCGSGKKYKLCHLESEESPEWKLGSPTPEIRAMAIARLVHELPLARLAKIPLSQAAPVALTEMASVYHEHGRVDEALQLLRQVLDGEREDPFLLFDYWIARYAEWLVDAGRAAEGEQFLLQEYDNPRGVKPWQVAQKLAAFYIDQSDLASADTWVESALAGDAENPFNHYLQGMLLHFDGLWEEAVAAYKQALQFSDRFREEEQLYMSQLVNEALQRASQQLPFDEEEEGEEQEEVEEVAESAAESSVAATPSEDAAQGTQP